MSPPRSEIDRELQGIDTEWMGFSPRCSTFSRLDSCRQHHDKNISRFEERTTVPEAPDDPDSDNTTTIVTKYITHVVVIYSALRTFRANRAMAASSETERP